MSRLLILSAMSLLDHIANINPGNSESKQRASQCVQLS